MYSSTPKFVPIICLSVLISACDPSKDDDLKVAQRPLTQVKTDASTAKLNREEQPYLIAPMIEGLHYCEQAIQTDHASPNYQYCQERNFSMTAELSDLLSTLEPGGATGQVQVGYTYGIPVSSLYEKVNGKWVIERKKIETIFNNIESVDRPVVIYPFMDHFDSSSELAKELALDNTNLMLLSNGEPPIDRYFDSSIIPYTLSTDESIPVNKYRFDAFRAIIRYYSSLSDDQKQRIKAISLAGETHHMFEDFQSGMGKFADIKLTDYSDSSKLGFREWLKAKYSTIEDVNAFLSTHYTKWADIEPPSKDIHTDKLTDFSEHIDSYAHGVLPIFGWLWNDSDKPFHAIHVYVDGQLSGEADYHLNRMDVYQALDQLQDPSVGFRYDLNFSQLTPGIHEIQVVASIGNKRYELTQQTFAYVDRNQTTPKTAPVKSNDLDIVAASELEGLRFYLDHPKGLQDVYYNPLADLWNQYRGSQVEDFINYVWLQAINSGAEKRKLFSHQIPTYLNSSWNTILFATEQSVSAESNYLPGVTLYGGSTDGIGLTKRFPFLNGSPYSMPEFHPQQYKSKIRTYNALMTHYNTSAAFVTPYYMSIVPEFIRYSSPAHAKFLIEDKNEQYGSNYLYQSILEAARM
ncbi:beta-galactosidase [Marinomonas algicola]|uniref:beta-galactosidase n=1 Tax=Marinomonas algicola TaxID=2773454 RepID=UPI00174AC5BD|nr:beta-galactosidase [Marinomonas algicola]